MKLIKDISTLHNYSESVKLEWLETNGLGGWAGSTIIGCNTRRYHGLLVAAVDPPADRMVLVSKLDETIVTNDQRFDLGTNDYGGAIAPDGHQYLHSFSKELFPEWTYHVDGIILKKTITMVQGENTTLIMYEVLEAAQSFSLELLPLIAVRGYHNLERANNSIHQGASFESNMFRTKAYDGTPDIFIKVPDASFQSQPDWYYHFNYAEEKNRGLDFEEDLFSHGKFVVELKQGDRLDIIISTEDPLLKDADALFQQEKSRKEKLLSTSFNGSILQYLTLAADQFIVERGEDLKTVIAGYHWFTDWGRDTMIALPGLCLSTGRHDDAKKIITAFANNVSMGMLPNRFPDGGAAPEYNNVDGTLWYFVAVHKYLKATNDAEFILREILPLLKSIIDWHYKGTRYNIHVTEDGLLYAGEHGQQLTWMDAKVGDHVITPRMGKPVEIQALWYNALRIFGELLEMNNEQELAANFILKAAQTKQSFLQQFWYAEGNYLYDVIDENNNADASLRLNQLFAISLPFALIDGDQAMAMLQVIEQKLYTPVGLRSLSADDPRYIGIYEGDQLQRDSAYHQGTVWSWLLGPYIDALVKTLEAGGRELSRKLIEVFNYHIGEACIGSVSEIFDGDAPHAPKGCVAQAWGVAEVLRVIKEHELEMITRRIF